MGFQQRGSPEGESVSRSPPLTHSWPYGTLVRPISAITQKVVDACGIVPIDRANVSGVGGVHSAEVYLTNIALPSGVRFVQIRVTKAESLGGPDLLIGMDIIATGDFAVTNPHGHTQFSFRIPSKASLDFVKVDRLESVNSWGFLIAVGCVLGVTVVATIVDLLW